MSPLNQLGSFLITTYSNSMVMHCRHISI